MEHSGGAIKREVFRRADECVAINDGSVEPGRAGRFGENGAAILGTKIAGDGRHGPVVEGLLVAGVDEAVSWVQDAWDVRRCWLAVRGLGPSPAQ